MTSPPQPTAVLKLKREHHATIKRFALMLSAKAGRRISQSDAVYLAALYGLEHLDRVAELAGPQAGVTAPPEIPSEQEDCGI